MKFAYTLLLAITTCFVTPLFVNGAEFIYYDNTALTDKDQSYNIDNDEQYGVVDANCDGIPVTLVDELSNFVDLYADASDFTGGTLKLDFYRCESTGSTGDMTNYGSPIISSLKVPVTNILDKDEPTRFYFPTTNFSDVYISTTSGWAFVVEPEGLIGSGNLLTRRLNSNDGSSWRTFVDQTNGSFNTTVNTYSPKMRVGYDDTFSFGSGIINFVNPTTNDEYTVNATGTFQFTVGYDNSADEYDTITFVLYDDVQNTSLDSFTVTVGSSTGDYTDSFELTASTTHKIVAQFGKSGEVPGFLSGTYDVLYVHVQGPPEGWNSYVAFDQTSANAAWDANGCDDLGLTDLVPAIRCAFIWAFYPSVDTLTEFNNALQIVFDVKPIGYGVAFIDYVSDFSATTSSSTIITTGQIKADGLASTSAAALTEGTYTLIDLPGLAALFDDGMFSNVTFYFNIFAYGCLAVWLTGYALTRRFGGT